MKHCSLSAFAVNVYMLPLRCSLSSTITTRHWAPDEKLLSTANTGFKSNKVVTAQKNRAAILASGLAERADKGYI